MNETEKVTLTAVIGETARTDYTFRYEWEIDIPKGLTDDMKRLLQKGFGETLRDKFSVYQKTQVLPNGKKTKVATSPEEKDQYTRGMLERLKNGTMPWRDAKAVGPMVANLKAWLMYYEMRGTKLSGKKVTAKNLHTAQLGECIAAMVNKDPSLMEAENRDEQGAAVLPMWIEEQEKNMEGVGGIIALQASMNSKTMA